MSITISATAHIPIFFVYGILYTAAAFFGAVTELSAVWGAADLLNWFMLVINLMSVLLLSGEAPTTAYPLTASGTTQTAAKP